MFGSKEWSYGQATIVTRTESGLKRDHLGAGPATYKYVADVKPEDGSGEFSVSFVQHSQGSAFHYPAVGERVRVKYDARQQKVEIDQLAMRGGSSGDMMGLDPELAELMRLEEAERTGLIPPPAPPAAPDDRLGQLERLADLRDRGVLTQAQFEAERARVLGEH